MTNPAHLLTVASLLLVAFLLGATIGSLARLRLTRRKHKPSSVRAATVVADRPSQPVSTVPTPAVAVPPATRLPMPTVPALPDFTGTLAALAADSPPPAFIEALRQQTIPSEPAPPSSTVSEPAASVAGMQPAHVAGETTSGRVVVAPAHENPPASVTEAPKRQSAEIIPFPGLTPESLTPRTPSTDLLPAASEPIPEAHGPTDLGVPDDRRDGA